MDFKVSARLTARLIASRFSLAANWIAQTLSLREQNQRVADPIYFVANKK